MKTRLLSLLLTAPALLAIFGGGWLNALLRGNGWHEGN